MGVWLLAVGRRDHISDSRKVLMLFPWWRVFNSTSRQEIPQTVFAYMVAENVSKCTDRLWLVSLIILRQQ
jgi:hypothetical protein